MAEAAVLIGRSPASLSRIENGVVAIPPRDVPPILDVYRVNDQKARDRLMVVAAEIQQERRGWWVEHSDLLSPSYLELIRLEATATEIRTYEVQFVPGLLQTEAYARVAASAARDFGPEEAEGFVAVRMNRREILFREQPIAFQVVLSEAALRNQLGGHDIFGEQVRHLGECASRDNITLQVLPFADHAHPGMAGAFTILRLPILDAAHVELMNSDIYVEDEASVRRYLMAFDRLSALALSPDESASFIAKLVDRI